MAAPRRATAPRLRESRARGIQSIEIGVRILDCLAASTQPLPLKEIARQSGMVSSKVRFYLISFVNVGLVVQDPVSGHYNLGPYGIRLGLAALSQWDVISAAKREMHDLTQTLGYTSFLAVWGNRGPTIVFRLDGRSRTVLEIRVGSVLPLLDSAIGRVFLTYLPRSATEPALKTEREASLGRNGSAERARIREIIEATRANGVAVARGTLLAGFTAIAAPILDHADFPVAALSISGPIGVLDDGLDAAPARLLKHAAGKLSEQIGWNNRMVATRERLPEEPI
jgi:DNA-binding IclR family transcriptional regulator